jgi:glutamate-ammonia-ligase adenylyltransferase
VPRVGGYVEDLVPEARARGPVPRRLPDLSTLRRLAAEALAGAPDEESEMVALRRWKRERVLHILALDLDGALDLDEVSGALSAVADVLLELVLSRLSDRLGLGPASPVGVIAYGKLGSREMSYASDTDIVFVYDSVGGTPETELQQLARAANRWLTAHTAAGALYQTDFRLRPYGSGGLLITPFSGFREYQREHARVWEHQALVRARWITGTRPLACAFEDLRQEIVRRRRDPEPLRAEVLAMRERIWAACTPPADRFDVKHSRGGIIDVEFVVQHLVLRHAADHPALAAVHDNAGALARGVEAGLLPAEMASPVAAAYRRYRQWMHHERLRGNELVRVARAEAEPHRQAVLALWRQSLATDENEPRISVGARYF